jgi:site-specific DNA-methyltransferase (cytosine-N4-specific)
LPPNLLAIPNSSSNSLYLRACKALGRKGHPARFPEALPEFFIEMLTDPGDLVLDIFSGSNTTGEVAHRMGRQWISVETDLTFAAVSAVRFMDGWPTADQERVVSALEEGATLDLETEAPPGQVEELSLPLQG